MNVPRLFMQLGWSDKCGTKFPPNATAHAHITDPTDSPTLIGADMSFSEADNCDRECSFGGSWNGNEQKQDLPGKKIIPRTFGLVRAKSWQDC